FRAFDDVLPGQAAVVRAGATPKYFRGNDQVGAFPAGPADDVAHHPFGFAVRVAFRVVKEVHPSLPGCFHARVGHVFANLGAEGNPGTERQLGDLQAGRTEITVFHVLTSRISLKVFEVRLPRRARTGRTLLLLLVAPPVNLL